MLNLDYLRSGVQIKSDKYDNCNFKPNKDKKIEYYRLSYGFKDANNYYLNSTK
jgi:hypothetical protein